MQLIFFGTLIMHAPKSKAWWCQREHCEQTYRRIANHYNQGASLIPLRVDVSNLPPREVEVCFISLHTRLTPRAKRNKSSPPLPLPIQVMVLSRSIFGSIPQTETSRYRNTETISDRHRQTDKQQDIVLLCYLDIIFYVLSSSDNVHNRKSIKAASLYEES